MLTLILFYKRIKKKDYLKLGNNYRNQFKIKSKDWNCMRYVTILLLLESHFCMKRCDDLSMGYVEIMKTMGTISFYLSSFYI